MQQNDIKAYIIPSIDAHQSEYLPELWQRRAWISGFDGSAGDVVLTMEKGGLWTDGRYYVQANTQLPGSGIDLFKASDVGTPSIADFLNSELKSGEKVGIDPKLMPYNQMIKLQKELEQNGQVLTFISQNLVDAAWEDQPEMPDAPIAVHPVKYAGETVSQKLDRIRTTFTAKGCGAHVFSMLDAVAWTFNLRGKDVPFNPMFIAYAIITSKKAMLFTGLNKVSDAVREALGAEVEILPYSAFEEALKTLAKEQEMVWVDPDTTSYWILSTLEQETALYKAMSPVIKFKAIKNEKELDGYRAAHIRDGVAMVNFLYWLENAVPKGGVTELSVVKRLDQFRAEQDMYQGQSFGTISSYKIHGAIIHYSVTEESDIPLEAEGIYLIDSGGQYLDGTTDITRTVALSDVGDTEKEHFTRVLMGHINLDQTSFPKGTHGPALDTITRLPLWEMGLNFNHGTGHGVGAYLGVHEGPQAMNPNRGHGVPLEPGMILSNEPGFYKDGEYGIRIENLVNIVVDEARSQSGFEFYKFENATFCPIDLRLVKKSIMTEKQLQWLNDYHAQVWEKLSPLVEGDVKAWLKNATRAI